LSQWITQAAKALTPPLGAKCAKYMGSSFNPKRASTFACIAGLTASLGSSKLSTKPGTEQKRPAANKKDITPMADTLNIGDLVRIEGDFDEIEGYVLAPCEDWGSDFIFVECAESGNRLRVKGWLASNVERIAIH
jgi:hypothetical protein